MLASNMICMACGRHGSIGVQEECIENFKLDSFHYLGHNSYTGAMHYQCPECDSYLNVDPMDMLKLVTARGQPGQYRPGKDTYSALIDTVDSLCQLPRMIKDGALLFAGYIGKNFSRIL